jgi:hypothetical protein
MYHLKAYVLYKVALKLKNEYLRFKKLVPFKYNKTDFSEEKLLILQIIITFSKLIKVTF